MAKTLFEIYSSKSMAGSERSEHPIIAKQDLRQNKREKYGQICIFIFNICARYLKSIRVIRLESNFAGFILLLCVCLRRV